MLPLEFARIIASVTLSSKDGICVVQSMLIILGHIQT